MFLTVTTPTPGMTIQVSTDSPHAAQLLDIAVSALSEAPATVGECKDSR